MPRLAGFLAVTLLIGITHAAGADSTPARRIAERTVAATVGIHCELDRFIEHRGAGIVISPDGHILTATSVVPPGAEKISVTLPGFVVRGATIVAVDAALGVAVIKVDAAGLPYLTLSNDLPAVGSTAYTAGNIENTMLISGAASFSRGLVSGVYDVPTHPEAAYSGIAIETTAAVNTGSDGGPLVDDTGRVCGLVTFGTLPLRWQGTAVPTKVLLEKFAALKSVLPPDAIGPAAGVAPADDSLRTVAAKIADCLAGIEVERRFPVERLPRLSWDEFKAGIKDYASLPEPEQQQAFNEYAAVARVFEVNQVLRRPPGAATGLVISADGFVLTSLFNLGSDIAFVRKSTGKPRAFDAHEPIQKLLAESPDDLEQRPNAITKLSVVLKNGSRHEAQLVAHHAPLGVALLKIESRNLSWYDVAGNAVAPQPGDAVGLVGHLPGGTPAYTLNSGIVSAPARNLGYQFQTDALLNYGNSGGPLFDCHGNFFGLAAAPLDPDTILGRLMGPQQLERWNVAPNSGVGMAARADRIRDVLGALKSGKSFERLSGVEANGSKASGDNVAGGASRTAPATDMVKLCAKARPAFVFLDGGSGVVVRPDGLMITNHHVIAGRQSHTVRLGDGRPFRAKLLGTDPQGDLAALKLDLEDGQTVPFLELGDSDALAVGDETLAVGNPFGLGVLDQFPTFTSGIVSALHHTQWTYTECIVSDTEVNPGNSGGPLLDMGGRVVGINGQMTSRFGLSSNTGLGFAISAKQIKLWLPRLEAAGGGEVKHGRIPGLGFAAGMVDRFDRVKVLDVAEGSAAAQAGFKPGDVILRLDDAPVANAVRLATLLGIYPEGQDVEVTVQRDGAEAVLRTTLMAPKRCKVGMQLARPQGDDFVPRVAAVEAGTPAATGGLQVGDEIVAVNGLPIQLRSQQEFRTLEGSLREQFNEGTIFTFKVRRVGGENKEPEELNVRVVGR